MRNQELTRQQEAEYVARPFCSRKEEHNVERVPFLVLFRSAIEIFPNLFGFKRPVLPTPFPSKRFFPSSEISFRRTSGFCCLIKTLRVRDMVKEQLIFGRRHAALTPGLNGVDVFGCRGLLSK